MNPGSKSQVLEVCFFLSSCLPILLSFPLSSRWGAEESSRTPWSGLPFQDQIEHFGAVLNLWMDSSACGTADYYVGASSFDFFEDFFEHPFFVGGLSSLVSRVDVHDGGAKFAGFVGVVGDFFWCCGHVGCFVFCRYHACGCERDYELADLFAFKVSEGVHAVVPKQVCRGLPNK